MTHVAWRDDLLERHVAEVGETAGLLDTLRPRVIDAGLKAIAGRRKEAAFRRSCRPRLRLWRGFRLTNGPLRSTFELRARGYRSNSGKKERK